MRNVAGENPEPEIERPCDHLMLNSSDEVLYAQYKQGDYDAFTILDHRHRGTVRAYLLNHMSGRYHGDIDDLIQTVLTDLSQKPPVFVDGSMQKWLIMIATRDMLDHIRHEKAKKRHNGLPVLQVNENDSFTHALLFHELSNLETSESLRDCIDRLPEIERQVIRLLLEGKSKSAAGRLLRLTSRRFRTHYERAIRRLKMMFKDARLTAIPVADPVARMANSSTNS